MLKLVTTEDERNTLLNICSKSALGCKIAAIGLMYGFDKKFANFWLGSNHDAAFCMLDSTMIISGTVTDAEEALPFLRISGAREVICAVRNADVLKLPIKAEGEIMAKAAEKSGIPQADEDVNIRELYEFFIRNDMPPGDFEAFYLDISHRLRHGGAAVFTKHLDGRFIAALMVSAITEESAIISAVAVDSAHRREGVGKSLLEQAEAFLFGKKLYVFKEKGKNEEFYKKLGFNKVDSWTELML